MNKKLSIFISYVSADRKLKDFIVDNPSASLKMVVKEFAQKGVEIELVAMDTHCAGDWDEWMIESVDKADLFFTLLSENVLFPANGIEKRVRQEIIEARNKGKQMLPLILTDKELPPKYRANLNGISEYRILDGIVNEESIVGFINKLRLMVDRLIKEKYVDEKFMEHIGDMFESDGSPKQFKAPEMKIEEPNFQTDVNFTTIDFSATKNSINIPNISIDAMGINPYAKNSQSSDSKSNSVDKNAPTKNDSAITKSEVETSTSVDCTPKDAYKLFGDTAYFGMYPQTRVVDVNILADLGGFDKKTWKSFDNNLAGYMYYVDKEYNGEKYRGVFLLSRCASIMKYASNSKDVENTLNASTVYWFKYEPIRWKVVENSFGVATLVSECILDSQEFYLHDLKDKFLRCDYQGANQSAYSNDYKFSSIRSWLNTVFYQTAFGEQEQKIILCSMINNSTASTLSKSNKYVCEDTSDNLSLLSYAEISKWFVGKSDRQFKGSDYAKCKGLGVDFSSQYQGNSNWWTRSPRDNKSNLVWGVTSSGDLTKMNIDDMSMGVVVCVKIKLK